VSAFYRCDYCGTECSPGSGMPDQKVWIEPEPSSKTWAKEHSVGRTSRVKVLVGLDGINPEPNHAGHDLCDPCIALHLREMLARLGDEVRS